MNAGAVVTLVLAGFVVFWLGLVSLIGRLAGWPELEQRFPDRPEQPQARLRFVTGRLGSKLSGGANYGRSLTIDVCHTGMRIAVLRLLAPFQSPVFVPWREIAVAERHFMMLRVIDLTIGHDSNAKALSLDPRVFDRLVAAGAALKLA